MILESAAVDEREAEGASEATERRRWPGFLSSSVIVAALGLSSLLVAAHAENAPLRVCLVDSEAQRFYEGANSHASLAAFMAGNGMTFSEQALPEDGDSSGLSAALRGADVALFWVHGQRLDLAGRNLIKRFSESGGGLVIVGAGADNWYDWAQFGPDLLGVHFGGPFANGAPLRVINLFPHAIFSGVDRFDTLESVCRLDLDPDAEVVMEGTIGEESVPTGWLRRHGAGRTVAFTFGGRPLLTDGDFQRILANSSQWASGRKIAGAETVVQRTIMPDAFPGALAVCFPGGPSLCYDTVRGGIDYIWTGDYVDLHPWWTARHGEPLRAFTARFWGEVFYRDKVTATAVHIGTKATFAPYHFLGYRLSKSGNPQISYSVDGRKVTEDLAAVGDGLGVVRTIHVSAGPGPLWLRVNGRTNAMISLSGAERDGDLVRFDSASEGEFTVTIRKGEGEVP
jgi:type 1 glutamine amidotransferase